MDMSTRNDNVLYRVFTRSSKRPGNFQQTSSKCPANLSSKRRAISRCILDTFAGSLLVDRGISITVEFSH